MAFTPSPSIRTRTPTPCTCGKRTRPGTWGQPPPPQPNDPADPAEAAFRGADTNKDNQLSREEAAKLPTISARFDELDKNRDSVLSFDEFRAGYRSQP